MESTAPSPSAQVEPPAAPRPRRTTRSSRWTRPIRSSRTCGAGSNPGAGCLQRIPRGWPSTCSRSSRRSACATRSAATWASGPRSRWRSAPCARRSPDVAGAWHQDGAFMGDVRALNVWLSLSHCGDEAPGLDLVPAGSTSSSRPAATRSCSTTRSRSRWPRRRPGESAIVRPIFEPGDVLLFDDLFLHTHRGRAVDAEDTLRDRELVLRSVRVP